MAAKEKFMDYIKKKFITQLLFIMIAIFCLYIGSLVISYQYIIVKKTKESNEEWSRMIEQDLSAYHKEIDRILQSDEIRQAIHQPEDTASVNELLYAARNQRIFKMNFTLLDSSGSILSTDLYESNAEQLERSPYLQRILGKLHTGGPIVQRVEGLEFSSGQDSNYLFGYPVLEEGTQIGYLLCMWEDQQRGIPTLSDYMLLTDEFDHIIYTSSSRLVGSLGKTLPELVKDPPLIQLDEEPYYVAAASVSGTLTAYNFTSVRVFERFVLIGIASFTAIAIVLGILMYVFSPAALKESNRSFHRLLRFIDQPEKGRNQQPFVEFEQIEREFEKKMLQINELMEKNRQIEETKRKMEINHLKNQFNPHFAFNVLEMLRYEISFNPKNAQEMVVAFANLMRYSTYEGKTTVAIGTDLRYVSDYLQLQKMRFQERLDYLIHVEEGLETMEVPKLLLQPIIENSIKHNMERVGHLVITIHIHQLGGELQITVQDNGVGIEPRKLRRIKQTLNSDETPAEHYGLFHCSRAIRLLYGEHYNLVIESVEGNGTVATIRLPIREEDIDV